MQLKIIKSSDTTSWIIISRKIFFKVVNKQTYSHLCLLKQSLGLDFLCHFSLARTFDTESSILFFPLLDRDIKTKIYFRQNLYAYIDFITPFLFQINTYTSSVHKEYLFGYIQRDTNILNYVKHASWDIKLIDLESIDYDMVILQPLYLFITIFEIIPDRNELLLNLFEYIILKFIENSSGFRWELLKHNLEDILSIFIKVIKESHKNNYQTQLYKFFYDYEATLVTILFRNLYRK